MHPVRGRRSGLDMAASQGVSDAATSRDIVAEYMTPANFAAAKPVEQQALLGAAPHGSRIGDPTPDSAVRFLSALEIGSGLAFYRILPRNELPFASCSGRCSSAALAARRHWLLKGVAWTHG